MPLPSLMIIDEGYPTGLGIVRSLGQIGIPIIVGSNDKLGRACNSRYATHFFMYPTFTTTIEERHFAIIKQVQKWRPAVLMPITDDAWSIIYTYYADYSSLTTIVPNPGRDLFDRLRNKSCLVEYAQKHTVSIPITFRPNSIEEAYALKNQLPYPVLFKPEIGVGGHKIQRVNNTKEFLEVIKQYENIPIIQERIEGEDLELTILCVNGKPLAGSAYMSLRNYPPPFGPPVACRTIINDKFMHIGMEFLIRLQYNGTAHLDFRRDQQDGQIKLLDFNPRLAGTNCISICSGVNFPLILYRLALGEEIEPCFKYKEGIEYRWYLDLKVLIQTRNSYQIIKGLFQWIFHWNNVFSEFSLTDPMPHILKLIYFSLRIIGRLNGLGKKLLRKKLFLSILGKKIV